MGITTVSYTKVRYHEHQAMMDWCDKNIGFGGFGWYENAAWRIEIVFGNIWFHFVRPQDATAFTLVWG